MVGEKKKTKEEDESMWRYRAIKINCNLGMNEFMNCLDKDKESKDVLLLKFLHHIPFKIIATHCLAAPNIRGISSPVEANRLLVIFKGKESGAVRTKVYDFTTVLELFAERLFVEI